MPWYLWVAFGLVVWCCVAVALAPVVAAWLKPPGTHVAGPLTPDVYEETVPVVKVAGRPPWAAPEADRYTGYGWVSGSMGSDYGLPPHSEAMLRRDLHHVDGLPVDLPSPGPGAAINEGGYNSLPAQSQNQDEGRIARPWIASPREDGTAKHAETAVVVPGAGDESEGFGLTAPPAPPERLCGPEQPHEKPAGTESAGSGHRPLRLLSVTDVALARCDLFMEAMRADHARWLVMARARWAA